MDKRPVPVRQVRLLRLLLNFTFVSAVVGMVGVLLANRQVMEVALAVFLLSLGTMGWLLIRIRRG